MPDDVPTTPTIIGLTREKANAVCDALRDEDFSKKIPATADLVQGDVETGRYKVMIVPPLTLSEEALHLRVWDAFQAALKREPNDHEFSIRPRAVNFNESDRRR